MSNNLESFSLLYYSLDGDYVIEGAAFESIEAAWRRSEVTGSRWFFYPIHFVFNSEGLSVAGPDVLPDFGGKTPKQIAEILKNNPATFDDL